MSTRPSWERVLAAMEAEAARAAALLEAPGAQAAIAYDAQDAPPVDVPATWRLPGATAPPTRTTFMTTPFAVAESAAQTDEATGIPNQAVAPNDALPAPAENEPFELPNPADLPTLDPEMLERLEQVHARIRALQSELSIAMSDAEAILTRPSRRIPQPEPRPELVDRRM